MSDQVICFFLALGIFAMMAALIPALDLIQRLWKEMGNATKPRSNRSLGGLPDGDRRTR
jgi:hypothetical protein